MIDLRLQGVSLVAACILLAACAPAAPVAPGVTPDATVHAQATQIASQQQQIAALQTAAAQPKAPPSPTAVAQPKPALTPAPSGNVPGDTWAKLSISPFRFGADAQGLISQRAYHAYDASPSNVREGFKLAGTELWVQNLTSTWHLLPLESLKVQIKDSRGGLQDGRVVQAKHGPNSGFDVLIPPNGAARMAVYANVPEARDVVSAVVTLSSNRSVEVAPGVVPKGLFASEADRAAAMSGKQAMACPRVVLLSGEVQPGADGKLYLNLVVTNDGDKTQAWVNLGPGGIYVYDADGNFVTGNFFNGGGPIPQQHDNDSSVAPDKQISRKFEIIPPDTGRATRPLLIIAYRYRDPDGQKGSCNIGFLVWGAE